MIRLALLAFLPSLSAAQAQESFVGQYGSASDPATSCATNPHTIEFMAQPPHAFLTWDHPYIDAAGAEVQGRRFDLEAMGDTMLTLREEGGARLPDGSRPTWFLRLTENPKGYCWGRADWPVVRCEDQQVLCTEATS
ncbi:hypothetical protein [Stagnihabitans tardus]|uniref:Uncharacterized protein n=1 Tax=Stagnihabitans tardus TaxID=2699202 RepID=A0AAE4Y8F9_9RHOB|nr:hypothetical protein [Stagnihabitans tardus]NBZ86573.1 hypothetical protein [Stagnihabitans tardus]